MNNQILNSYITMRRAGDVVKQGNQILFNKEINDQEKLRQLLNLEFLRVGVGGVQGNYKLITFLCEKDNLEQLIKFSIGVPESPENTNESYKYPNVSQELLCSSAMLAQAIVEGGFMKQYERSPEDGEENPNHDEDDEDDEREDDDDASDEDEDDDERDDSGSPKEDGVDTDEDEEQNDGDSKDKENNKENGGEDNAVTSGTKKTIEPKKLKISINDDDDEEDEDEREEPEEPDEPEERDENDEEEEEDKDKEKKDSPLKKDEVENKDEDDDDLNEREDQPEANETNEVNEAAKDNEAKTTEAATDKKEQTEDEDAKLSSIVQQELEKYMEEDDNNAQQQNNNKQEIPEKDEDSNQSNKQEAAAEEGSAANEKPPESEEQPDGEDKSKEAAQTGSPQDAAQDGEKEKVTELEEPDREDADSDEKDGKEEGPKEKKEEGEKPAEEDGDAIKVSDVFLNMNLAGEKSETMNSRKKDDDDDEVDFERDDENDVENVAEEPDTGNKVSNHTIIKRSKNQVNVSVKIYTKKGQNKKKKGKKSKKKKVEEPPPNNPNDLLDVLFSFIGVSSQDNSSQVLETQYKLGLFEEQYLSSRQTAGTTTKLPGETEKMADFSETMSSRSSRRDFNTSAIKSSAVNEDVQPLPELLPVSCGYFKNILLKILLKQRKQVIKYLLLDTQGRTFDQLLKYVRYHSLADLLMELMQLSVVYQQSPVVGGAAQVYEDDAADQQNSKAEDGEEDGLQKNMPKMTGEQAQMYKILQDKKHMVISGLIGTLSYRNTGSLEDSLNATQILIEMVELEKTFEIFMMNGAEKVGNIMELAVDCTNSFNQQYLLQILLAICKQLKQSNDVDKVFRDLDEDGQETTNETKKNQQYDPSLPQNRNLLKFLDQVEKQNMFSNLLLTVTQEELDEDREYSNQNRKRIQKIGQKRLKSLEVMHSLLQLLYPSNGKLAVSMMQFIKQVKKQSDSSSESEDATEDKVNGKKAESDMDSSKHPISLARFLPSTTRRNLVKTLLLVLQKYSYCSIASQLCIQILGQIMTMFDVVDVCLLQKFVIKEFKKRHEKNKELDESMKQLSIDEGSEYKPVSRYKIDHENMQSAQVNQMTSQLKERVDLVRKYYNLKSRQEIKEKTGVDVMYDDLITEEDRKYWTSLCKKDFRRLEKYQVLNIGEGHFMDESDEPESEDEQQKKDERQEREPGVPLEGLLFHKGERQISEISGDKASEDDNFNHDKFMEDMMRNIQEQQNSDEAEQKTKSMQEQIKEMELQQQKKRDQEEAAFSDNNFWRIKTATEAQADVDELLRELEGTDETPGQDTEQSSEKAEKNDESEQSKEQDSQGDEKDEDNKEQKEESSTNSQQKDN